MIPEIISEIRSIDSIDLRIVAVDTNEPVIGQIQADNFYRVPAGNDAGYCDAMLDICDTENVDIVVPLSDEEALALAEDGNRFRENGTNILGSSWETTKRAGNKIDFLTRMQEAGRPTPAFAAIASLPEFDAALKMLGYPLEPVVCKPANQRGGRGFRVIHHDFDELAEAFDTRREIAISDTRLRALLADAPVFPELLLMEFLSGAQFSVDVHVSGGKVRSAVAQKKFMTRDLNPTGTEIFEDRKIDTVVEDVVSCFGFDHLINIDMAERVPGGPVLPFEVNVRPSSLIAAATASGTSLLRDALCRATGTPQDAETSHAAKRRQFIGACFV